MDQVDGNCEEAKITSKEMNAGESHACLQMNSVLENHLLREMIIAKVISTADNTGQDIGSLRLINKTWLTGVSKLHRLSHQPLCFLKLDETNSLNKSDSVRKNGQKELERFMSTMKDSINGNIPPFRLTISKDFFCDENYKNLCAFFGDQCLVNQMIQLDMSVPYDGGSLTFLFRAPFIFSRLNKITVKFCRGFIDAPDPYYIGVGLVPHNGSNSNFVPFIQTILDGSENLREMVLNCETDGLLPAAIKYLIFPTSLTKLYLDFPLNKIHFAEVMRENSFSNLTHLRLQVTHVPTPDGLLFEILDHVKTTLVHFSLPDELRYGSTSQTIHILRFPVMPHLESLDVRSEHVQLTTRGLPLQTLLPKLKRVNLGNQTAAKLRQWTRNVCFPNVTIMHLHVYNSIEQDLMEAVHVAFPSLKEFTYNGSTLGREALRSLFMTMSQLTVLRIWLARTDQVNSDHWDSLLIGCMISELAELREKSHLEWYKEYRNSMDAFSIKNLTSLDTLELYSEHNGSYLDNMSLISDLAFDHALLQMPNLENLVLNKSFKPSPKMKTRLNFSTERVGLRTLYRCKLLQNLNSNSG